MASSRMSMGTPLKQETEPATCQLRFVQLSADDVHVGLVNQLIN